MTDPIADMLTRIRNAQMAGHSEARAPHSKIKFALAKILESEGYLAEVREEQAGTTAFKEIVLVLKYNNGKPAIREVKRVSKPGRRIYAKTSELPRVLSDIGIAVVSTPNGLMTNKEARRRRLGGEVICQVF